MHPITGPDHPRVCGEQLIAGTMCSNAIGSSPRVRGTGVLRVSVPVSGRIIPACAGNRNAIVGGDVSITDHPRVCGEQEPRSQGVGGQVGSSPRVRGTGPPVATVRRLPRIIPACAGNSTSFRCSNRHTPDHPRVCGEQAARQSESCAASGSSPRVRGTGRRVSVTTGVTRIIPACAGNRTT